MTSSIEIPYYTRTLPSPLPTNSDIEMAPDISTPYRARRVVRVAPCFVVKFGLGVDLVEGENMMFVRASTNVVVPEVYALYSDPQTGVKYIIMEHIVGDTLESLWPNLLLSQKKLVVTRLRAYFDELRRIPSPGYFGSLGERPLLDDTFWTPDPDPSTNGPFHTEDAFNEALMRKYACDGPSPRRAAFYCHALPCILSGPKPTFTHGDCQRKNILMRQTASTALSIDGGSPVEDLEPVFVDWEKSGWYPSYWEYSLAFWAVRWNDDWDQWLDEFLDNYTNEAFWLERFRSELWS
ncbi:hypothetical protein L228DRAFT_263044 [Xylona heveae TC161]|uniref:Uncharacterized protein n=1 Tax=Xylona heveae (strain CBS 132557 / TC161) TaxID=1328760 RepID=A0A165AFJ3_XYLHT|nr:hypothetical protein L228DRAFT_263044 [Xylona heveae TC161]KZF20394.1 hypothetical protein L228DRAFT_263044 [Xylona heveae TC161]